MTIILLVLRCYSSTLSQVRLGDNRDSKSTLDSPPHRTCQLLTYMGMSEWYSVCHTLSLYPFYQRLTRHNYAMMRLAFVIYSDGTVSKPYSTNQWDTMQNKLGAHKYSVCLPFPKCFMCPEDFMWPQKWVPVITHNAQAVKVTYYTVFFHHEL